MTITEDHWLSDVVRLPLAGGAAMTVRRFLVIHFTSGATARSSVDFWRTPVAKCESQSAGCVPYYRWVTDYIAILGGR